MQCRTKPGLADTSNVRRTFLCAAQCAHFAVRRTVHCAHSMLISTVKIAERFALARGIIHRILLGIYLLLNGELSWIVGSSHSKVVRNVQQNCQLSCKMHKAPRNR
jgi:hypothetical protein